MLIQFAPFVVIFAIMYFLILRPQQQRAKEQREMVQAARRGDVVVTTGGLIGKITKSTDDNEVELEIAPNVRVRLARSGIADVRVERRAGEGRAAARQDRRPRKTRQRLRPRLARAIRDETENLMLRLATWKVASILALIVCAALLIVPSF